MTDLVLGPLQRFVDRTRATVEDGSFRYTQREVEFSPSAFMADPAGVNRSLLEVLYR